MSKPRAGKSETVPALLAKLGGVGKGGGMTFKKPVAYDAGKPGAEFVWTNLETMDHAAWNRQCEAFRALAPGRKRWVDHWSLSLDPRLGKLTLAQWEEGARAFLDDLGYQGCIATVYRHQDEPQDHVHCTVLRVRLGKDGKVETVSDSHIYKRSHIAAQRAARKLGLNPLPPRDDATWAPAPTDTQIGANKRAKRRGTKTQNHASIARTFDHIVSKAVDLSDLESKLLEVDVELQIVRKSGGSMQGLNVRSVGAVEWEKASGLKPDRSLSWLKVEARLASNLQLRKRAQAQAEQIAAAARNRAEQCVADRLGKQPEPAVPQQARALLPEAVNQESNNMVQLQQDAEGPLSFLSVPTPRPAADDDARLVTGEGDAARARRIGEDQDRRTAAAESDLQTELKSATKTQLERLRRALTNRLHSHDDDAIERLLARLTRLVVRVLSCNQIVLPATEAERRVLVDRATIERIDAELLHRQTDSTGGQPKPRPSSVPVPVSATAPKFAVVRTHDARQASPATSECDRDERARRQDAERERNRK